MQRLVSNKRGETSYGQKWQNTESSSDSESDYDDGGCDLHSHKVAAAREDNEVTIPKVKKRVEVTAKDGEMMYRAALQGDWVAAEVLLERDRNLAFDYVTEEGDRALHVAAAMKHREFVEKLVGRMNDEVLALLDGHGYTACCYAAISGDVEIARLIIGKRPNLVTARDEKKATPLRKAALQGNGEMVSCLLGYAKDEDLSREEWFDLLLVTIRSKMLGEAKCIMGKNKSIATMANEEGTALHLLAQVGHQPIEVAERSPWLELYNLDLDEALQEDSTVSFHKLAKELRGVMLKMQKEEYAVSFHELAKELWGEMLKMQKDSLIELMKKPVHIIHEAAKTGQVEIITMLTRSFPQLIWETDTNGYTIFHMAVMYRRRSVFLLVPQVESMLRFRTMWQDRQGNNILHLSAMRAAGAQVKLTPAYQIQRELKWFQDVKKIVPPSCVTMRNVKELTPGELFSKTHRKLLKESQTWMINKADSSMLIVTILLTVVFAAAFTVPGGYASLTGEPVLAKKKWFKVFVVFEVLSIMCSVVSITMFQSIMASSFAQDEYLFKLTFLQRAGFQFLLLSLMGAFLAFMASISLFNLNMSGLVWFGFAVVCLYCLFWALGELSSWYQDNIDTISIPKSNLFKQEP